MNLAVAHPDRAVVELTLADLQTIEAALSGFERYQQREQTAFGIRIELLTGQVRNAQAEIANQMARAFGLAVEGDDPIEPGAF